MQKSNHETSQNPAPLYSTTPLVLATDLLIDEQRVPIKKCYNYTPRLPRAIAFYLRGIAVCELEDRGLALGSHGLYSGNDILQRTTAPKPEMDQIHVYAAFDDAWFEGYTYDAHSTSTALATQERYHLTVKQEIGEIATAAPLLVDENHIHRYGDLRKHASDRALSCSEVRQSLAAGNRVSVSATILKGEETGRQVVAKLGPQHLQT